MARPILLVDDDIAEISAVKRVLARLGHPVVLATNASDALALLEEQLPAALVVATALESGEGGQLARKLSGTERTGAVPLVLLGDPVVEGAQAVPLPVDAPALEAAVRRALAGAPPLPSWFEERRAAADALRARAEELRRAGPAAPAAPPNAQAASAAARPSPPTPPPPPSREPRAIDVPPFIAARRQAPAPAAPAPAAPAAAAPAAAAPDPASAWFEEEAPGADGASRPLELTDFAEAEALRQALSAREAPVDAVAEPAPVAAAAPAPTPAAAAVPAPAPNPAPDPARARAARDPTAELWSTAAAVPADSLEAATEALRRRAEEEARRRAEMEAELAQLTERARRAEAERAALEEAARRAERARDAEREAERQALEREREAQRQALEQERRASAQREAASAARRAGEAAEESRRAAVAEAARRRVKELARGRAPLPAPTGPEEPPAPPTPELLEGRLADTSLPRWLALAARARVTGRLELTGPPPRALWLEGGRIVGARSGEEGERTEDVALRLNLLSREQHRLLAPACAGLASRRVGVLLLERGLLDSADLAPLARRRAEEVVFAACGAGIGYRFHPGEPVPTEERVALERGTLATAVEGVRRRWTRAELDPLLGGPATLLAPAAAPPPVAELHLTPEEQRLVERADGLRTLDELLADAPLDPLLARQVLGALAEVGALEVRVLAPLAAPPRAARALDLDRVEERLTLVRRADYFEILGIPRASTPYAIRQAAEQLLAELAPERFPGAPPELGVDLEEIRLVVTEARDVLCDEALRAEYLAALQG